MEEDEFVRRMEAIEAETEPPKRRRLQHELHATLKREHAAAFVALVEEIRAKAGDAAAEEVAKVLREGTRGL